MKVFKDGSCMDCDKSQVETLAADGWSFEQPEALTPEQEADAAEELAKADAEAEAAEEKAAAKAKKSKK